MFAFSGEDFKAISSEFFSNYLMMKSLFVIPNEGFSLLNIVVG